MAHWIHQRLCKLYSAYVKSTKNQNAYFKAQKPAKHSRNLAQAQHNYIAADILNEHCLYIRTLYTTVIHSLFTVLQYLIDGFTIVILCPIYSCFNLQAILISLAWYSHIDSLIHLPLTLFAACSCFVYWQLCFLNVDASWSLSALVVSHCSILKSAERQ